MTKADHASQHSTTDARIRIVRGCSRLGLLSTTALQAVTAVAVLAMTPPAQAQLSASAQPAGGRVVAGQASIAQTANRTTVTQSSQNAAVNWQSYDVGSANAVQYTDPSSKSITLNRVTGPNPSEIAGHIVSNGTVIIVNQAGLLFDRGAQVNTAGLVVSAAGISNSNFMAGKLVFDQPAKPGAKVENRGTITIADQGLAALVAPQVANSGVIRANLGKVILAGAEAEVLDLYGDGMLSINVTKQVTTAPDGGAALVTNTGAISARGGTVVLTAQAVDGVVQTLVNAGGKISASTVGTQTGRVVIAGAGGDVIVSGSITANGHVAGTAGGAVVVNTTGTVAVASTARISASGPAGGGTIAIGTTLKRAAGGPSVTGQKTAASVTVAAGAVIAANATKSGNGGRVTVLSTNHTSMAGTITAKGGETGGDGGFAEVSGSVLALTGLVDTSAPIGHVGTLLLDPNDLNIVGTIDTATINGQTAAATGTPSTLSANTLETMGLSADVVVQATGTIDVMTNVLVGNGLSLDAGSDLLIDRGVTVTTGGLLFLSSGTGAAGVGSILIGTSGGLAPVILSGTAVVMQAGSASAGGIGINLTDTAIGNGAGAATVVDLSAVSGGISQSVSGIINAGTLQSSLGITGTVTLAGTANNVETIGAFTVNGGDFTLYDNGNTGALVVSGPLRAANVVLDNATGANINGGTISIQGSLTGTASVTLVASNGGINDGAADTSGSGVITTPLLAGSSKGYVTLLDGRHSIAALGANGSPFQAVNGGTRQEFSLSDGGPLAVNGLTAGPVEINAAGLTVAGTIISAGSVVLNSAGNMLVQSAVSANGNLAVSVTSSGTLTLGNNGSDAGTLSVSSGGTISINTDALAVGLAGGLLSAATGVVEIAPTSTLALSYGGTAVSTLDVPVTALGITASTLRLGATGGIMTAESIDIATGLTALSAGTVDLESHNAISESTGSILAAVLTGSAGTSAGFSGSNAIATLGSFTAPDGLTLTDGHNLSVTGPVTANSGTVAIADTGFALTLPGTISAQAATLAAGSIGVDGLLSVTGTASLAAAGGITETGSIAAATLTGSAGTSASFSGSNAIAALGSFTAPGGLAVTDGRNLAVAGPVTTSGGTVMIDDGGFALTLPGTISAQAATLAAGSIGIGGLLSVTGTASLAAADDITETGSIAAATLTGSAGTSAGFSDSNAIATLGSFTAPDGLTLTDGHNLSVTGPVTANSGTVAIADTGFALTLPGTISAQAATLAAGSIGVDGLLSVTGTASLAAAGGITETGSIAAATLTGSAGTSASFSGSNAIAALGSFTAPGGLTLTDGRNLAVAGPVTASGGTVMIDDGGFALSLPGTLSAQAATLAAGSIGIVGLLSVTGTASLAAAGGITETGSIAAVTLTGSAGTSAGFSGSNAIATLASFTSPGGLTLTDAENLSVTGPVTASGGTVAIADTGFALTLPGTISAQAATLAAGSIGVDGLLSVTGTASLAASGGITETGSIAAATLTGSAGTSASFSGNNAIATLANFTASTFTLDDDANLAIAGTIIVQAATVSTLGSLLVTGSIGACGTTGDTTLISTGSLTVAGTALIWSAGGTVDLDAGSGFVQSGGLIDGQDVVVHAPTGEIGLNGGQIAAADSINVTASSGALTENGGIITANGPITLIGGTGLAIEAGMVIGYRAVNLKSDSDITISGGEAAAGSTLTIGGYTGTFSAGDITQNGGTLAAGVLLTALAGNNLTLAGGSRWALDLDAESFGTADANLTDGAVTVTSGGALVYCGNLCTGLAGAIPVPDPAQILTPGTLGGGMLKIAGGSIVIDQSEVADTIDLSANGNPGNITESGGGALSARVLEGFAAAAVSLALPGMNRVETIGSFSAGTFNLTDTSTVSVTGPLSAGTVTLNAGSIVVPGTIIGGTLVALYGAAGIAESDGGTIQAGTLVLASNGGVTQTPGGTINAGTLFSDGMVNSGTIGGTIALLGTANTVGTIGPLAATGDIQLLDTSALTVAANAQVQSVAGNIYIESTNTAGIGFGASATLDVLGTHKTIGLRTDALTNLGTIGATGSVAASAGTFELAPYTTGSLVSFGTTDGLSLATLDGITANRVRLGAVTAPGAAGAFTLAGSIAIGGTGFNATAVSILELDATGDVGQTAPLSAITLTGSAASFTLTNTLNSIGTIGLASAGTLGSLDAPGTIIVDNGTGMTIAGLIQAGGDTTISLPGTLSLTGEVLSAAGNTWLDAGTIIISQPGILWPIVEALDVAKLTATVLTQEAGLINAGTVTIAATGSAALNDGLIIATAGSVGITSPTVSVGVTETIAAVDSATAVSFSGNVRQASSYIGSNGNVTVGGTLTEQPGGTLLAIGKVSLGGLSQSGGTINAGAALSVGHGTGIAGWAGSAATSGYFAQSGGMAAAAGSVNIFTFGNAFLQNSGVLASGGTLGVTAANGITVGATVSAAGTPSGFMLLATAGDAVLTTSGLLAGPATIAPGDPIAGNAVQAEAGTVLIAGTAGTQAFGQAGTVGTPGPLSNGYTLGTSIGVTPLTTLAVGSAVASGEVIPAVLIGGTVDIERPIAATTLGLYARTSINEATGAIAAATLTGSAGVPSSGALAPGLAALGWTNADWETGSIGSVALTPSGTGNTIDTLSDFAATGNFALTDSTALTQAGTLQAGVGAAAAVNTTGIAVHGGALTINGLTVIGTGSAAGGHTTLSSTGALTVAGTIAVSNGSLTATAPTIASSGVIDAPDGSVSLTAASTLAQTAGVIAGGSVSLQAPAAATLSHGAIVATTGTVGIFASTATVSEAEIIAALNTATGVVLTGDVSQAASSYIGSNGSVSVAGLLSENGGNLLAAGNVALGSLSQTAGTIAAGKALTIGSSAHPGSFSQSGGLLAATGNGDIVTAGAFIQTAGVVATGGTLGVTAGNGIDIAGTISAAGSPTGFALLAAGGDAVLEATGLLAGPALNVQGDSIPGNALLAPSGTVRIAGTSGTQGFGQAGAVGGIAAVSGYAITQPANPPGVLYLSLPTVAAPSASPVPVKLSGATIDLQRPVTASNLGLFAAGAIIREANAMITASRLTGASGAAVNLLQDNAIGILGAFDDAGQGFHLVDSSNLMLAGLLTARSVWIEDASYSIDLTAGSAFAGLGAGSASPLKADPFPAAGAPSVYLMATNFAVLQNPSISTGSVIDWTFALTGSGNVDLGVFRQPEVKLFLRLASGTATGALYVAGLQLNYTTATSRTINLIGSVGNVYGQNAASNGHMSPLPKNNYQINGCPISSVNCIKFTGLTVPVNNPLREVEMGFMQYQDDAASVLPDVADRDY